MTVTATVKNTGTGAAYRVLPRIQADDGVFEDFELPIGKVAPGETKTFTAQAEGAEGRARSRRSARPRGPRGAQRDRARHAGRGPRSKPLPRPVFAYAWQLVDDGNGDGLVQRGEKYHLQVRSRTPARAPTQDAQVLLRNATGDGVDLDKSRFELKDALAARPDQGRSSSRSRPTRRSRRDEMVLELMAYDPNLDASRATSSTSRSPPASPASRRKGDVTVKAPSTIHAGAADDTSVVGTAPQGRELSGDRDVRPVDEGQARRERHQGRLHRRPRRSRAGGAGTSPFTPTWNSTPPLISLTSKCARDQRRHVQAAGHGHRRAARRGRLRLRVEPDARRSRAARCSTARTAAARTASTLDFATDLPLWPGSNMVTVVARANNDVRSVKTVYVYRDPPRTAATP